MMTVLLIIALLVVLAALVGVVCQICGGGFGGAFHCFNNSIGKLLELLVAIAAELLGGSNS